MRQLVFPFSFWNWSFLVAQFSWGLSVCFWWHGQCSWVSAGWFLTEAFDSFLVLVKCFHWSDVQSSLSLEADGRTTFLLPLSYFHLPFSKSNSRSRITLWATPGTLRSWSRDLQGWIGLSRCWGAWSFSVWPYQSSWIYLCCMRHLWFWLSRGISTGLLFSVKLSCLSK